MVFVPWYFLFIAQFLGYLPGETRSKSQGVIWNVLGLFKSSRLHYEVKLCTLWMVSGIRNKDALFVLSLSFRFLSFRLLTCSKTWLKIPKIYSDWPRNVVFKEFCEEPGLDCQFFCRTFKLANSRTTAWKSKNVLGLCSTGRKRKFQRYLGTKTKTFQLTSKELVRENLNIQQHKPKTWKQNKTLKTSAIIKNSERLISKVGDRGWYPESHDS